MDATTVTSLIGSLGFPIVMCFALFYFINKTLKEMQTAIMNNTTAITELTKRLGEGSKTDD